MPTMRYSRVRRRLESTSSHSRNLNPLPAKKCRLERTKVDDLCELHDRLHRSCHTNRPWRAPRSQAETRIRGIAKLPARGNRPWTRLSHRIHRGYRPAVRRAPRARTHYFRDDYPQTGRCIESDPLLGLTRWVTYDATLLVPALVRW